MKKSIVTTLFIVLILASSIVAEECIPGSPFGGSEYCPDEDGTFSGFLTISSVDVSPDNPEPGEEVEIEITIDNDADEDIENIDITIEIDGLEDDDGDDLEDDDETDIRKGRDDALTFTFIMPYDVDDGDSYDIIIEVEGRGEDTRNTYTDSDSSESLEFDKESHALYIKRFESARREYSCDDSIMVEYDILNIGRDDEEVEITIINDDLEINFLDEIEIDEFDSSDDEVRLSANLVEGEYSIELVADFGNGEESSSIDVTIGNCEKEVEVKSVPKSTESKEVVEETITPAVEKGPVLHAKPVTRTENSFDSYGFLLIILFIILLGLVIYAIGAVIILYKKWV